MVRVDFRGESREVVLKEGAATVVDFKLEMRGKVNGVGD